MQHISTDKRILYLVYKEVFFFNLSKEKNSTLYRKSDKRLEYRQNHKEHVIFKHMKWHSTLFIIKEI